MKIDKATDRYQKWLGKRITLIPFDLRLKHERMAQAVFPFFRATFYRWAQTFPEVCPQLFKAPVVVSVGDLHVENFGTWHDGEGRLVWGVNDFDEASPLPYTNDLVRLATSLIFARGEGHLAVDLPTACVAILDGYRERLKSEGHPFVLWERDRWLRDMVTGDSRDPAKFWRKIDALYRWRKEIPKSARKALENSLPDAHLAYSVFTRATGLGSLGRQRFVAVAEWHGGRVVREAKALATSASFWAGHEHARDKIFYRDLLDSATRSLDPSVRVKNGWLIRRLAPYCVRVELTDLPKRNELKLLRAMGYEAANIHWGTASEIPAVKKDLTRRGSKWLHEAATLMAESIRKDWKSWRRAFR